MSLWLLVPDVLDADDLTRGGNIPFCLDRTETLERCEFTFSW